MDKTQAMKDIRAVSGWCLILIYFVAAREGFGVLASMFPNAFYQIYGYDISQASDMYHDEFLK
jgi:hypothetical protein